MRMVCTLNSAPTGLSIQLLATRIQSAESLLPSARSQVVARCCTLVRRFYPKKKRPTKAASRKKATIPSIASGAPNTSPT